MKASQKQDVVLKAVDGIVDFTARTAVNEHKSSEVVKAAVGLLGDLGQTFGKRVLQLFREPFVNGLIQEGLADEEVREIAIWAQQAITAVLQSR